MTDDPNTTKQRLVDAACKDVPLPEGEGVRELIKDVIDNRANNKTSPLMRDLTKQVDYNVKIPIPKAPAGELKPIHLDMLKTYRDLDNDITDYRQRLLESMRAYNDESIRSGRGALPGCKKNGVGDVMCSPEKLDAWAFNAYPSDVHEQYDRMRDAEKLRKEIEKDPKFDEAVELQIDAAVNGLIPVVAREKDDPLCIEQHVLRQSGLLEPVESFKLTAVKPEPAAANAKVASQIKINAIVGSTDPNYAILIAVDAKAHADLPAVIAEYNALHPTANVRSEKSETHPNSYTLYTDDASSVALRQFIAPDQQSLAKQDAKLILERSKAPKGNGAER